MAEGAQDDRTDRPDEAGPGDVAGATGPGAADESAADVEIDIGRRRFFRQLAADVFQATATVVGAANALQQTSIQAASAILDPETAAASIAATGETTATGPQPPTGFRTAFRIDQDRLILVDQRQLPGRLAEIECRSGADVAWAIREMVVRGAPAIGQAAAYGLAMTAGRGIDLKPFARRAIIRTAASTLRSARPTAINLAWAIDRMLARMETVGSLEDDGSVIADALWAEAEAICAEATHDHGLLAEHGLALLPNSLERPLRVLTHCNTGPLACGQYGTALGIVQAAHHAGRPIHVWVDETRPYLQGARLTAWELAQADVPHTLIADTAAGHLMARGEVDVVIVGADRIAANGDTANKVGTYTLAVLAARHGIPFFVAAPISTVDLATENGEAIPIEERKANEVLLVRGVAIAPPDTDVRNPAFDITPADLITGIVTDEGVIRAPYPDGLAEAVARRERRRASAPGFAALTREPATPTHVAAVEA